MLVKFITSFMLFVTIKTAKILVVVPTPSISHQVVYRPLIQELIKHNHNVTVITTDPVYTKKTPPDNINEIDLHDLSYELWNKMLNELGKSAKNDMLSIMTVMYHGISELLEKQLKDRSVQQFFKNNSETFDLLIVEAIIDLSLIYTHYIKAPVIQISTLGANPGFRERIGAMTHPLLYPSHFHEKFYNLTIWEKMSELYKHVIFDRMVENQRQNDNIKLQHLFGINTPTQDKLKNNVHMLFLNIHPIWCDNQPVPSTVEYTWGIYKTPDQILFKELQSYLDNSKNGVVYVSFGGNVKPSLFPLEKREILLKVFSQLPYDILLKWDTDNLPDKPENVKISKWFPQYAVLRHQKVKLFITQGGLQSTDEAINAAVPLIGIPMFADQEYNTEKYVHFKIGVRLDFKSLTVKKLKNAINTILTDKSYRKNIIQLQTRMHDQPQPALENAIWWVEYILRHGGVRHLRAPAANMSWTDYYELDLVFLILGGLTVFVIILLLTVYSCFKYILCSIYSRNITTRLNILKD